MEILIHLCAVDRTIEFSKRDAFLGTGILAQATSIRLLNTSPLRSAYLSRLVKDRPYRADPERRQTSTHCHPRHWTLCPVSGHPKKQSNYNQTQSQPTFTENPVISWNFPCYVHEEGKISTLQVRKLAQLGQWLGQNWLLISSRPDSFSKTRWSWGCFCDHDMKSYCIWSRKVIFERWVSLLTSLVLFLYFWGGSMKKGEVSKPAVFAETGVRHVYKSCFMEWGSIRSGWKANKSTGLLRGSPLWECAVGGVVGVAAPAAP